jgi:hypothetical protein
VLRVYLDEDVSVVVAKLLAARGFDCITTLDAAMLHQSDDVQLEFAARENRVLATHNRTHFERLAGEYWAAGKEHAGILVAVRRRNVYELTHRLVPALRRRDQQQWRNCLDFA